MIRQVLGRLSTGTKALDRTAYDCIDLFRANHMKAEAQLIHLRLIKNPERRKILFEDIRSALEFHLMLEELFLYPTCDRIPRLEHVADKGRRAHELMRGLMAELAECEPNSRQYNSRLMKLVFQLEKHLMSEEDKLFPVIRKYVNATEFRRMNREILTKYESEQQRAHGRRAA